jgi:hypothetical protein
MKRVILMTIAAIAVAAAAAAQQPQTFSYTFEHRGPGDAAPQVQLDKLKVEQLHVTVEAKATPNAPYSAETSSESVQVLADGNRIVRKTLTRVYRDSAGRTRREMLGPDGQIVNIAINDPATGVSYFYESDSKVASRSMLRTIVSRSGGDTMSHASGTAVFVGPVTAGGEGNAGYKVSSGTAGGFVSVAVPDGFSAKDGTIEDLGQQTVEGVLATGKRTTITIVPGQVGNELPIKVVSEEWYSPELQLLVLTKHSDPRVGETTYRLTNISRTEPDKSLFELPAGVTVKEPDLSTHFEIKK